MCCVALYCSVLCCVVLCCVCFARVFVPSFAWPGFAFRHRILSVSDLAHCLALTLTLIALSCSESALFSRILVFRLCFCPSFSLAAILFDTLLLFVPPLHYCQQTKHHFLTALQKSSSLMAKNSPLPFFSSSFSSPQPCSRSRPAPWTQPSTRHRSPRRRTKHLSVSASALAPVPLALKLELAAHDVSS